MAEAGAGWIVFVAALLFCTKVGGVIHAIEELNIKEMELTARAERILTAAGIDTVGKLLSKTCDELLNIDGFGIKSLESVERQLAYSGRQLARGG